MVATTQELIAFVVIRFKTCLAQGVSLRLENGVSRLIPIFIQGFEPVYVGHGDGKCCPCFTKSAPVRQSCHFRGEQFSPHLFGRHLGYTPPLFQSDPALAGWGIDRVFCHQRHPPLGLRTVRNRFPSASTNTCLSSAYILSSSLVSHSLRRLKTKSMMSVMIKACFTSEIASA